MDQGGVSKMIRNLSTICKGKKVLDVGCIGQVGSSKLVKFKEILSYSPSFLLGIDLLKKDIQKGKEEGYNFLYQNIENELEYSIEKEYSNEFDVTVLRDVIEHFSNCGKALDNIHKLLKGEGLLYIITPNVFNPKWLKQVATKGSTNTNPDHVCWYDNITLKSILKRHGFKVIEETVPMESSITILAQKEVSNVYKQGDR